MYACGYAATKDAFIPCKRCKSCVESTKWPYFDAFFLHSICCSAYGHGKKCQNYYPESNETLSSSVFGIHIVSRFRNSGARNNVTKEDPTDYIRRVFFLLSRLAVCHQAIISSRRLALMQMTRRLSPLMYFTTDVLPLPSTSHTPAVLRYCRVLLGEKPPFFTAWSNCEPSR